MPPVPALPRLGQPRHRPHLHRLEEQRGQAGVTRSQGGLRRGSLVLGYLAVNLIFYLVLGFT